MFMSTLSQGKGRSYERAKYRTSNRIGLGPCRELGEARPDRVARGDVLAGFRLAEAVAAPQRGFKRERIDGAPGPQGIQGIQGIQGAIGPAGPQGAPGIGLTDATVDEPCTVTNGGVAMDGFFAWVEVASIPAAGLNDHNYIMACVVNQIPN